MRLNRYFRTAALATAAAISVGIGSASLAVAAPANCAGDLSGEGWLNVEVTGVRNSNGLMAITIYPDDSSRFLAKKSSLDVVRVPAQAGTTKVCVKLPGTGVYAIAVYHDEDSSRKLNRNGIGMPTEGFGFSNNPATLASIPTFKSVRLNVPKNGLTTRIALKYP